MFTGLGAFVNGIVTSAQTALVPAVLALAIVVGGFKLMTGDHQDGRRWITGGLFGAGIALLAVTIASAALTLAPH